MKYLSLTLVCLITSAACAQLKISNICEERYQPDDLPLVIPQRQQLFCQSGANGPWHFVYAGFETKISQPLELIVTGSGDYQKHDIFSIAALAVDYGNEKRWIERSIFGLGLIQDSREPHPPGWGVGGSVKPIMRGELVSAKPQAAKVKLDLKKYAPAGWDGRVFVSLLLHNPGASKYVSVTIVDPRVPQDVDEPDADAKMKLLREHEGEFLSRAATELENFPAPTLSGVVESLKPYAAAELNANGPKFFAAAMRKTLANIEQSPPAPAAFVTHAEAYFAWQKSRDEKRDVTTPLNRFFKRWQEAGAFGKNIGYIVRAASNLDKVGLTDVSTGTILRSGEPIKISAARREYEGFQIVLTPLADLKDGAYEVRVGDLQSDHSAINAKNVTINPVGYVKIYPGQAYEKLCPDPLLMNFPALKAGENQPIWFTVYVPPNTAHGEYRGSVTITNASGSISVPTVLRVRAFEIPKKISLRSSFWLFRDSINRFYHVKEVNLDDYLKWIDFALQHRVNPIDVDEGLNDQLVDINIPPKGHVGSSEQGTVNPKPNFARLDRYIDRMISGGANTLNLGTTHHFGKFFTDEKSPAASPQQIERVKQATKIMADHFKSRGVLDMTYLQLRDETSEPDSLNVYRAIQKEFPELKLLLTAMSPEARPLLKIPCPLSPSFDAGWRDEVKSKGGEYWWYVCLAPNDPYANLFIQQTGAQHRALFWQTWSHGVDGLLYWGLNYWSAPPTPWPQDAHGPTQRVQDETSTQIGPIPQYPGDGFSIYPGPTIGQPMSSIRLECMRDGEEDYEYLVLLEKLIRGREGKVDVTEARKALDDARKLVADMTQYEKSGQPYLELRDRVADTIEKLSKP